MTVTPWRNSTAKTKKLLLFGIRDFAQIACEYFTRDSEYEVAAFVVDREYLREPELLGHEIVPFDEVSSRFPPSQYEVHVCVVYDNLNRTRAEICNRFKEKGYTLARYISSRAFVSPTAKIGEHCFVFEGNTVQPFVTIGDNVILWSGNHVGHHSVLGHHLFISSHVVISGWCTIGDNVFIGVNATLANNTVIGKETWAMHGAIIAGTIPPNSFVKTHQSEWIALNERVLAKALEKAKR